MRRIAFVIFSFFIMISAAYGEDDPIMKLTADTISYFKPVTGVITQVEGKEATLAIGEKDKDSVRPGMRLKILREGAPFVHPVTKEVLGKIESTVGQIEIKEVHGGTAKGVVAEGDAKTGDKVRISDTKVKLFFCQDKGIDWYLADEYYRRLKASGRIEMIDTALETADESKVLAEAKKQNAEIAMVLTAKSSESGTVMRERVYWVSDGAKFIDDEVALPRDYSNQMKIGEAFFAPRASEVVLKFDLPLGEEFVTMADVAGDGNREIVLATSRKIGIYKYAVDLEPMWDLKISSSDDVLWLDALDLNNDRKDEIIVTSMKNSGVVSYIYEFNGSGFTKLWEGKYFLRRLGNGLIAQAYSDADGFSGDVFQVAWNGSFGLGEKIKLPKGVNIYDFAYVEGMEKERLLFAYDDNGFMNLYDDKGTRVWRSSAATGSFKNTFKKQSQAMFRDAGEWSIKDRLISRRNEVLAVQRVPIAGMAKTLGNKSSRIRQYWWNGFSMEEGVLADDISGNLLDYSFVGDQMAVLTKPIMGIKFGNILKGESMVGTELYIYMVKGR